MTIFKKNWRKGEHLTAEQLNENAVRADVEPRQKHGFTDKRMAVTKQPNARMNFIEFIARPEGIAPYSVFSAVGQGSRGDMPNISASDKGIGFFTNGPDGILGNQKGIAQPISYEQPVLVRRATGEDTRPYPTNICGIGPNLEADRTRGGLVYLCDDITSGLGWVMRNNDLIDMVGVAQGNIAKRERGDFRILDENDENAFSGPSLFEAFNIHWAGLAGDTVVRITNTIGHGLVATKFNGGMWFGVVEADIEGETKGSVKINGTDEILQAWAGPDGLAAEGKVNVIEYHPNDFYAYPLDCEAVLDGGGNDEGNGEPKL